ncbi:FAD-dependent monooxygenase elcH [Parastagonospora nodorum]|nr:FAD-dependent monooxygenase elcH [Parastagonospora nodorum]KAH4913772.1 FAD-dependent monooxygenase elcH [Parastagonospora nodorum]KAH4916009.1 FAD-dependent monooxygenase elcH [Parastagonospora nodorum]
MFTLRSLAILAVFAATALASKQSSNDRELVVAIYGGGLASATLAQALKGSSNLNVQYFDPALDLTPTSFRLFGFDPKVHDALALVNEEAGGAIERSGWYPEEPSVVVVGQGSDADTVVLDWAQLKNTTHHPQVTVVDPKPFLQQMLNGTDESRLHPNKTLVSITRKDLSAKYPLELKFQDGSIQHADVLIGDDGPFGQMRSEVLGAKHPANAPVFMNFLSAVAHVAPDDAEKLLGQKYGNRDLGRRFERVGMGSWFLNAYLEGFSTCLGSFYTEEAYDLSQFTRTTSVKELTARFSNLKRGEGITGILSGYSGLRLIPEIEHSPAPTYINGLIAMQGNAAHFMTNFQQLGPSQQIEDAMILGTLLRSAHSRADVEAALYAYDTVRRPRSQWVSEHGKRLGWLWTGMVKDVGIDAKKLKKSMLQWKEDSEAFDLKAHKNEAVKIMKQTIKERSGGESVITQEEKMKAGFQGLWEAMRERSGEQAEL